MNDEHMPMTNESVTDESVTGGPVDYENLSPAQQAMTDDIIGALKSVYDPEIPVDIYELGLIYRVEITDARDVIIDMTLTAPGCPVAEQMPIWVQDAIGAVEGVGDVKVNMVFEPAWDISRMSDEARVALNMF
ncbi:MAG: SUF system Fe-S cluster assembly protein [Alphaproteobacteria bacterium]|nr:SUF system Fe-S cluster assembly protein [Alphaproteobacteria bacterium]